MRWRPPTLVVLGTVAGLTLFLTPPAAQAQESKKVNFITADSVKIFGTFYPGAKKEATVLLLHAIGKGEDSNRKGWDSLAKALQAKGYAVLRFDFRGHGDSTEIEEPKIFYSFAANNQYVVKSPGGANQIELRQIKTGYSTCFINDIAAAKAFLDRRNDAGECNSSSLIVIGAESGATLGAVWLNSEWRRYELIQQPGFRPLPAKTPEGKFTIAAVWLSFSPKVAGRAVSPAGTLYPALGAGTPMSLIYAEDDPEGKAVAGNVNVVLKKLKNSDSKKYGLSGIIPLPGAEKLKGQKLLATLGPKLEEAIITYVGNVVEAKGNEYVRRDFQKASFVWLMPNGLSIPAKASGESNFLFNTYAAFAVSR
jgi:pimeloyl-ACP methyl ester carboxylesterase